MASRDRIIHEYSIEIYNRHRYYYQPKRRMYALTRNLLMIGIALTVVAFIIDWLIK